MTDLDATQPLSFGAALTAVVTLLAYTNVIPATVSNILLTLAFGIIYLIFGAKRKGFTFSSVSVLIITVALILINKNPAMISLTLIWIIFDIASHATYDLKQIAKSFLLVAVPGYIAVVTAYVTIGFNASSDISMWRINKLVFRSALGFAQPNMGMMYVLAIVMATTVAYKMSLKTGLLILITSSFIFSFTQSRTAFLLIIALVLLTYFHVNPPFIKVLFIMLASLSCALVILPINPDLNMLLSGRLSLYDFYRTSLGVHLLSNPLAENTMLDNSYIQMVLSKGILFTTAFFAIILNVFNTTRAQGRRLALIYMVSAFPETTFLHFDLLLFVILTCAYLQDAQKTTTIPQTTTDRKGKLQ